MNSSKTEIFEPGEIIIRKGDNAQCAYMISSGKVRVYLENEGKTLDLAQLKEGQIFGETAMFESSTYGANVMALEQTELLVITPESLDNMLNDSNPVLRALIEMLIQRLNDTNKKLLESETRGFIDIGFV